MEKSSSKWSIALLILIIIGLVGYICYDKGIIEFHFGKSLETKAKKKESKNEKEVEKEVEKETDIDISSEMVQKLFYNSHNHHIIVVDQNIYGNESFNVSQMDDNYKMALAANKFGEQIVYTDQAVNGGYKNQIEEAKVKVAYEQIFGPNTYKTLNSFTLLESCGSYTYDSSTKMYVNITEGCGGTTGFISHENIIKATQFKDRIEIIGAVVFYDKSSNTLYKDYLKKDAITKSDHMMNKEELESYVNEHQAFLQQYTYTYRLNEDGSYYYSSVKRTNK